VILYISLTVHYSACHKPVEILYTLMANICLFPVPCPHIRIHIYPQTKKEAERALKRLFDVHNGDARISPQMLEYVSSDACPAETGKALREASRKTLTLLPEQSDDEEGAW
jgi:hypothetical protein